MRTIDRHTVNKPWPRKSDALSTLFVTEKVLFVRDRTKLDKKNSSHGTIPLSGISISLNQKQLIMIGNIRQSLVLYINISADKFLHFFVEYILYRDMWGQKSHCVSKKSL